VLKYFSVTPLENSGSAENSTENSGPHAKNFFCSMYESSLRHPVSVPEINVKPVNSKEKNVCPNYINEFGLCIKEKKYEKNREFFSVIEEG
jgi:hypothetical protein